MCGLTGFLGGVAENASIYTEILERMAEQIRHRGPDDGGVWIDSASQLGLGHRRLAVLDLSPAGHQPMLSASGRYVIAFNGEIYNHLDLRVELQKKSQTPVWRGTADTETLCACFDAWGIQKTLERAVGMFAFALWDRANRTLTLARDRLGEKPMYYGWQGIGRTAVFIFGSELKSLRAHPAFSAQISRDALSLYIRHNNVGGERSIYDGIFKLLPGTWLTVSQDAPEPKVHVYWSATEAARTGKTQPFLGSEKEAIDALDDLLKSAVARQMVADVPLGAFLSGGVDSSTIVALMQAQSPKPVKTFSIGFNEPAYNEAEYAKAVARHLGTDHTELYVLPQEAMGLISRLPRLYDEPFADSSQIPTFLVSQLARKHVAVSLSGDAGDELFGGYNRYKLTASLWGKLSVLPWRLRQAAAWCLTRFSPESLDAFASYLPRTSRWVNIGEKLHKGAAVMGAQSTAELYLRMMSQWQDPLQIVIGGIDPTTILAGVKPGMGDLTDVERMMALDLQTYLPDDILVKVDRAAMGVSLETRLPFLDHRVVEFAWRLPMQYKLRYADRNYTTKWALRQVLFQYVPKALIERPKMGFGVPIDSWLRGPLRAWAEDLLSVDRLKRDGYLNPAPIRQKWAEHVSGQRNWQHQLWCVLMFQAWLAEQVPVTS